MSRCGEDTDGSRAEILRQVVTEKLSSITREIVAVVERTIVGYEEEASGYRREIHRQKKLLECLLQPRVKLERKAEITQLNRQDFVIVNNSFDGDEKEPRKRQTDDLGFLWHGVETTTFDDDTPAPKATSSRQRREDLKDPDFEISDTLEISSPPVGRRRPGRPPRTHFFFRFCVLEDPQTDKPSENSSHSSAVQLLQCPRSMDEAEFMDLLKSSFPQLAGDDKHFHIHKLDKRQRLQRLRLKMLKPNEIHKATGSSQGKAEVLYIRLKTGDEKEDEEEEDEEQEEKAGTSQRKNRASNYSRYLQEAAEFEEEDEDDDWQPDSEPWKTRRSEGSDAMEMKKKQQQCKLCGVWYRVRGNLIKHIWTHVDEPHNGCGICGENFQSTEELKRHMESYQKLFFCSVCGKAFLREDALQNHSGLHSDHLPFKCDVCLKAFDRPQRLKVHRWIHTAEKPHKCDLCPREFGIKAQLQYHRRIHLDKDRFQCIICTRVFFDKRTLTRHRLTHFNERLYGCDVCGKRFKLPQTLKSHKKTHGERDRPFLCHVCSKTFVENGSLKAHMKVHSGERPFVCDICDKGFLSNGLLKAHRVIHSSEKRFSCSECGYWFKRKQNLNAHMRTHTDVKQFVCNVCGKACGRKAHLTVHMRTHNGERPYECNLCDKAFTQSHCLKTHMKKHEGLVADDTGNLLSLNC